MSSQLQLDQPLPAEVLRRTSTGLAGYRNYPVFSWPWLRQRTMLVGLGVGAFAGLLGFMVWVTQHEALRALWVFLHFILGALVITTAGPLLATVVRQRRLRQELERRLVVVAVNLDGDQDPWCCGPSAPLPEVADAGFTNNCLWVQETVARRMEGLGPTVKSIMVPGYGHVIADDSGAHQPLVEAWYQATLNGAVAPTFPP